LGKGKQVMEKEAWIILPEIFVLPLIKYYLYLQVFNFGIYFLQLLFERNSMSPFPDKIKNLLCIFICK